MMNRRAAWVGPLIKGRARESLTPLAALTAGGVAGAAGTAALTAAQLGLYALLGEEQSSAPGEVGKRVVEGVFDREVPEQGVGLLNHGVHWAYGTVMGAAYGLVEGSMPQRRWPFAGLLFGAAAWGSSLLHLPAMKLAPPVWKYPPRQIGQDAGFHLLYGLVTGGCFALLEDRLRR